MCFISMYDKTHYNKKKKKTQVMTKMDFPGGSAVKNPPANAGNVGDPGSIPRWGRSSAERNVFLPG